MYKTNQAALQIKREIEVEWGNKYISNNGIASHAHALASKTNEASQVSDSFRINWHACSGFRQEFFRLKSNTTHQKDRCRFWRGSGYVLLTSLDQSYLMSAVCKGQPNEYQCTHLTRSLRMISCTSLTPCSSKPILESRSRMLPSRSNAAELNPASAWSANVDRGA